MRRVLYYEEKLTLQNPPPIVFYFFHLLIPFFSNPSIPLQTRKQSLIVFY